MKLSRTRVSLGLLSLALVAAGLVLWRDSATEATPVAAAASTGSAFVRSMQDTVPDGDLRALQSVQQLGQTSPLAYAELKRLFDYYLSAIGEQSIEAIAQQVSRSAVSWIVACQHPKREKPIGCWLSIWNLSAN